MRFILIAAVLILLMYGCMNIFDSTPSFDDELAYIEIEQARFSPQSTRIVIRNVSNRALDRLSVEYRIIPTTDTERSSDITFEPPRHTVLEPGDTLTLTARNVSPRGIARSPHYRLRGIKYREVPF